MQALQILQNARALIARKENWTIDYLAKTRRGEVTSPTSTDAYSFCALGALCRAKTVRSGQWTIMSEEIEALHASLVGSTPSWDILAKASQVAVYNNTHSHQEVLEVFDRAIQKLHQAAVDTPVIQEESTHASQ